MRTIEIVIRGPKVVEVGYRAFLLVNAMTIGIGKVFAFNIDESVVVRVCGAEDKIDRYVDFVKSAFPLHAQVDKIEVKDFEGEVTEALVFMQFLQFEQINKAIPAIISIDKKQDIMISKQDIMISKQDIMISKQEKTLTVLEDVREDTSIIRKDVSSIKNDVSTLARQTALEDLEKKYELLSREVAEIKENISEIKAA
jgi:acylphosphatase